MESGSAIQSNSWAAGKKLALASLMLLLAVLCVVAADGLQEIDLGYWVLLAVAGLIWLGYSLLYGMSFRAAMIWISLYFIKPLPLSFYVFLALIPLYQLIQQSVESRRSLKIPYPLAFFVLFIAALQGIIRARDFNFAFMYFSSTLLVPLLIMIFFANARIRKDDHIVWLKTVVLIGALLGFIGTIMGISNPTARLGSLWVTAMTINGFYTLTFFFGLGLALRASESREKLFWALMSLLIFLGMMYTYTRIALVAVAFGMLIIMWRIKRFRLIGLLMAAFVPVIIPSSMAGRLEAGVNLDTSTFVRGLAWYYSVREIIRQPLFGMGISVWKDWYKGVVPLPILYAEHSHNLYLKILVEIGLFGFIPYFYIVINVLRRFYKTRIKGRSDQLDFMIYLAVLALLLSCMTDIFAQQDSVSMIFWMTLAFMYQLSRRDSTTKVRMNNEGI